MSGKRRGTNNRGNDFTDHGNGKYDYHNKDGK